MEFVLVRLYYPNRWRQNIGDLVGDEDKKFNWFLCSKIYYDEDINSHVVEINLGTRFYDDEKGIDYILKEDAKLVVVKNREELKTHQKKYPAYQGLACTITCDNPSGSIVCPEALFLFKKDLLKVDASAFQKCPIIHYAKSNYKCIKSKIPQFPSPQEIDSIIEKGYPISVVCKVLYEDISYYTSRI